MTAIVTAPAEAEASPGKAKTTRQALVWSHVWTPGLVSLRVTRDPAFRFTPGHYARVGIARPSGSVVFRPLSVASAPADSHLEFFCTLVPGGEFSDLLAGLRVGDGVEIEKASFGFLTVDSLAPGTDLWLLATGTGLAPYMSMLRDRGLWQAFERIVVVHSVRYEAELAYADELRRLAAHAALRYIPVVTREPGACDLTERIPALLASGRLAQAAGVTLDPATSRVMVCGNPEMTRELRTSLGERGFRTTRRGVRGQIAFEKYW
jgi:ferredoxin--NADP+ reductase